MTIIINYLWIQRNKSASNVVPPHLFDNVRVNALRYPRHGFRLWVEDPSAYQGFQLPRNVEVCCVATALEGQSIPIFSSKRDSDFWSKVDIGRLLVLRHALAKPECAVAVYADFDIADLRIHSDGLWQRLSRYGAAFGASYSCKDGRQFIVKHFENGYMAFTTRTSALLDDLIFNASRPTFFTETKLGRLFRHSRDDVYVKMSNTLQSWANARTEIGDRVFPRNWLFEIAGLPIQPPSGWHAKVAERNAISPT